MKKKQPEADIQVIMELRRFRTYFKEARKWNLKQRYKAHTFMS